MYERTIFISFSSWYWIDSVQLKPGKNFQISSLGRRSCKQLSDTVTERKNLLPNSGLRAERDCTPTYAHAESYSISYTIWWMILRALFCRLQFWGLTLYIRQHSRVGLTADIQRQWRRVTKVKIRHVLELIGGIRRCCPVQTLVHQNRSSQQGQLVEERSDVVIPWRREHESHGWAHDRLELRWIQPGLHWRSPVVAGRVKTSVPGQQIWELTDGQSKADVAPQSAGRNSLCSVWPQGDVRIKVDPEVRNHGDRCNIVGANLEWWLKQLVEMATGGRPEDLSIHCIRLQPLWTHPCCSIIDAHRDVILMLQWCRRLTEICVSSACRCAQKPWYSITDSRSAMYNKKRIGPRTDPCGTPHPNSAAVDVVDPARTYCRRSQGTSQTTATPTIDAIGSLESSKKNI